MQPSNLIAHFTYTQSFWNDYVTVELKNKKEDNYYFAFAIAILCTGGLMFLRDTTFLVALAFSLPFAILIPYLRQKLNYKYLVKNPPNPEVKIFDKFLKINNHSIEFRSDQRRLKGIKLIEASNGMNLLEFDIQWITRKGPTNDEYRIPIPKENLEDAQKIINTLST
ncbi:MAG: hypothetical protein CMB99_03890 [Flavobacteriaceae bacterium]|nr:hypothetical protein [Flavobacteriaceae bacterium]|tara:strand:+ start:73613 stop:74113 length:501 start_codon:yes stop_codon:yes gene_type:complete